MIHERVTKAESERKTAEDKSYPNMPTATALLIVGITDYYQHSRESAAFPPRDKNDKCWFASRNIDEKGVELLSRSLLLSHFSKRV